MLQRSYLRTMFFVVFGSSASIGAEPLAVIRSEANRIGAIAFAPDGKLFAFVTPSGIRLWDVRTRKVAATLDDTGVRSIVFAPNGKTLAAGNADHAIRLWDMAGGKVRNTLQGHTGAVGCLAFALQGRCLVSGSSDRSVIMWDLETSKGEVVGKSGQQVNGIAVAPDGKMLAWPYMRESAVSLILGTQVRLIDVSTKRSLGTLHELFGADRLAFSPDGKVLATSSVGSKVNLWKRFRS